MYQPQYDPFYSNMAVIKKYFKTKMMLTSAVLRIGAIIMSILYSVALVPVYAQAMPRFSEWIQTQMGDTGSSALFSSLRLNISPVNFTSFLVPAVTAFATFFIFFKSKNDHPSSNPRVGFLIKHIIAVYLLINSIVSLVIGVITFAAGVILVVSNASGIFETVMGICIFLLIVAFNILTLLLSIANLQYFKSIRHGLTQPKLENKGAKTTGLFSVISAVFYGWMALAMIGLTVTLILSPNVLHNRFVDTNLLIFPVAVLLVNFILDTVLSVVNAKIAFGYHKYADDINSGRLTPEIPKVEYIAPSENIFEETAPPAYTADHTAFPQTGAPDPTETLNDIPSPTSPRYCPYCGNILSERSIFCSRCGNKVQ